LAIQAWEPLYTFFLLMVVLCAQEERTMSIEMDSIRRTCPHTVAF